MAFCNYPEIQKLSPEYKNASKVIDDNLSQNILVLTEMPQEYCFSTGEIIILSKDFKSKQIPGGFGWRWNQVKGRKQAILKKSGFVGQFYKLMPRPLSKNSSKILSSPKKLWRFDVFNVNNPTCVLHVLWCEKGEESLKLEDYEFLAPFVEPSLAKILWPKRAFC